MSRWDDMTPLERMAEIEQRAMDTKDWDEDDFERDIHRRRKERTRDWAAQGHPYGPPDPDEWFGRW